MHGGRRAFAADLPRNLLRLQRREFFRVTLPLAHQPLCSLDGPELPLLRLPIQGLSIAGLSFIQAPEALAPFEPLAQIPRCRFDIGEAGYSLVIHCAVEVRYITEIAARAGRIVSRMGCRFIDPSAALQNHVQRYMMRIERERRARAALE
jgi:c-di-GMP-binding flagellar brake protein YcgR